MTPSQTSTDVSLLQSQGDSAIPDTKVFINQTAYSFHEVIEERERECLLGSTNRDTLVATQSTTPSPCTKGSVDYNSVSTLTQLNRQLTLSFSTDYLSEFAFFKKIYSRIKYISVMSSH